MRKESRKDYLLRLWKARQEEEGHDVSNVKTLEEAEHYFDTKENKLELMTNKELVELGKKYNLNLKFNVKKTILIEEIENAIELEKQKSQKTLVENSKEEIENADIIIKVDGFEGATEGQVATIIKSDIENIEIENKLENGAAIRYVVEEIKSNIDDNSVEDLNIPEATKEQIQEVNNVISENITTEESTENNIENMEN